VEAWTARRRTHVDVRLGARLPHEGTAVNAAESWPLDFLYSGNRLNVAASRARSLFFLVLNPDVIDVDCKTPHQMRLVNAFCHALDKGEWVRPA